MALDPNIKTQVSNGLATINAPTTFRDEIAAIRKRVEAADPTATIDKPQNIDVLSFPNDRPKYFMSFAFEDYQRPTQFEGLSSNGLTDYISLPLPNNLKDDNHLNYATTDGGFLNDAIGRTVLHQSEAYKKGGLSGMIDSLKTNSGRADLVTQLGGDVTGFGINRTIDGVSAIADKFVEKGLVSSTLQQFGLAQNPFPTIGFNGPGFKSHEFTWRLSPKSKAESDVIKKITDTFKKVAYPELLVAAVGGFYRYPKICFPRFNPDEARNYLYNFKPCVISDISINYTPNDRPGFYGGSSAPVEVIFSIKLVEIELWRNGDGGSILDGEYQAVKTGDFNDIKSPPPRKVE